MKKKCKVVMLPTGAITNIKIRQGKLQCYYGDETEFIYTGKLPDNIFQHLYLISDDEIKEGDWFIDKDNCLLHNPYNDLKNNELNDSYKVIASTDPGLFKTTDYKEFDLVDGDKGSMTARKQLPQIPESFIKEYVKNPVDEVMVEYDEIPEYDYNADYVERFINVLKLTENNEIIITQIIDYEKEM